MYGKELVQFYDRFNAENLTFSLEQLPHTISKLPLLCGFGTHLVLLRSQGVFTQPPFNKMTAARALFSAQVKLSSYYTGSYAHWLFSLY